MSPRVLVYKWKYRGSLWCCADALSQRQVLKRLTCFTRVVEAGRPPVSSALCFLLAVAAAGSTGAKAWVWAGERLYPAQKSPWDSLLGALSRYKLNQLRPFLFPKPRALFYLLFFPGQMARVCVRLWNSTAGVRKVKKAKLSSFWCSEKVSCSIAAIAHFLEDVQNGLTLWPSAISCGDAWVSSERVAFTVVIFSLFSVILCLHRYMVRLLISSYEIFGFKT